MSPRSHNAARLALALMVAGTIGASTSLRAQESPATFLRGDVNDDGVVSLADASALSEHLFRARELDCAATADVDADTSVSIVDAVFLLSALFVGGDTIPEPYPDPGASPFVSASDCTWTGGQPAIDDPTASISLGDAVIVTGAEPVALIPVRYSASFGVAGLSGRIESPTISFIGAGAVPAVSTFEPAFLSATEYEGHIDFGVLAAFVNDAELPTAGEIESAFSVRACVPEGTSAGVHSLELTAGELVRAADSASVTPSLAGAELVIEEDVTEAADCAAISGPSPEEPEDLLISYRIERAALLPGDTVEVGVSVRANVRIDGFSVSVDFDESVVQLEEIRPNISWSDFTSELSNADDTPGSSGVDEGWLAIDSSSEGSSGHLVENAWHTVAYLRFSARDGTEGTASDLVFTDGAQIQGASIETSITSGETVLTAASVPRFFTSPGRVVVATPGSEFLRGDVNADGEVSFADVLMLRRWLFFGARAPLCEDAADVDDDGTISIVDAISLAVHFLEYELDEFGVSAPYPAPGIDPSLDDLACVYLPTAPEKTDDLLRLGDFDAMPGAEARVPILISTGVEIEAWQVVIAYDPAHFTPRYLDYTGVSIPGEWPALAILNGFEEEGVIVGGWIGSFTDESVALPAGESVLAATIVGDVARDVPPGTVISLEPTNGPDEAGIGVKRLRNEIVYRGDARFVTAVPELEGALAEIVGDVTFFRGDANLDQRVDISDAVYTLDFLFRGGDAPKCADAMDADDDGRLLLTDAVVILEELFDGVLSRIAPPYPEKGSDATPDDLPACVPST